MITKTTKPWHAITFYFMSLRRIWLPFLHSFPSGIYKHWLDPSWVFLFSRLSHLCRDFRLIYTSVVCQLIQHVYGSLLLGSLKLDTAFQAWPDQGWEERTFIPLLPVILPQCRPWLSWCFFFFAAKQCCRILVNPLFTRTLKPFSGRAAGITPHQKQNTAFSLSELHESTSSTF